MDIRTVVIEVYSAAVSIEQEKCSVLSDFGELRKINNKCHSVIIDDQKRIFIFSYGTVVFCGIETHQHNPILQRLGITTDSNESLEYQPVIDRDVFCLEIGTEEIAVSFNKIGLPEWDEEVVFLITEVVARSSALDVVEHEVSLLLSESEKLTRRLGAAWIKVFGKRKLLRFLADGLMTRHRMITQLAVLDEPESVWTNEKLYNIFLALSENFDLAERVDYSEKMIALCGEVSGLLLEIDHTNRAEWLEITIVVLILIEIVQTLW